MPFGIFVFHFYLFTFHLPLFAPLGDVVRWVLSLPRVTLASLAHPRLSMVHPLRGCLRRSLFVFCFSLFTPPGG